MDGHEEERERETHTCSKNVNFLTSKSNLHVQKSSLWMDIERQSQHFIETRQKMALLGIDRRFFFFDEEKAD